jgi:putative nucleotidyltransferase with HDIG domain
MSATQAATEVEAASQRPPAASTPRVDVRAALGRLSSTGTLPMLPHVASAALGAARDETVSAEKIATIIKADVGLTACVLRLANSAAFARRTAATTLPAAIMTVGLRRTYNILIAAGAQRIYGAAGAHAPRLWKHALAVGIGAEEIAWRMRRPDPQAAFLPGLFHDIGRIVLLLADTAAYDALARALAADDAPECTALEREWCGLHHGEAGAELAGTWGLTPEQVEAIRWHHAPEGAGAAAPLAALVAAADAVAYAIDAGSGARPPAGAGLAVLGFSAEDEAVCVERIRQQFTQQLVVFG